MSQKSCECEVCRSFCEGSPGWFMPGEVERVAEFLKLSEGEMRLLVRRNWLGSNLDVPVPSPKMNGPVCTFYVAGKCSIHPVKPHECRTVWHKYRDSRKVRAAIVEAWAALEKEAA